MTESLAEPWSLIVRKHFLCGWWGVAIYMALGIALETMHGFKIGYYLSVDNETRRLMWTLAHTHGTLLSLLNVALAATLFAIKPKAPSAATPPTFASKLVLAGWVLLPLGFFLGGVHFYGGDPGPGVLLVPVGALLALAGIVLFCRSIGALLRTDHPNSSNKKHDASKSEKRARKKGK